MKSSDAAASLEAMQASRERLAALANCPPQRHLVFALLLGGVVAAQAATPFVTIGIEVALGLCVLPVMIWDRRRTGMFINGYRAGRTRPLTLALVLIFTALMAVGVWLKLERGLAWAPVACGALMAVTAFFMSLAWQAVYRRELRNLP